MKSSAASVLHDKTAAAADGFTGGHGAIDCAAGDRVAFAAVNRSTTRGAQAPKVPFAISTRS
jgi:hypothetical protein